MSSIFKGDGPKETQAEIVIGKLFRGVRTSDIWEGHPTLYPASRSYLVHHFHEIRPSGRSRLLPSASRTRDQPRHSGRRNAPFRREPHHPSGAGTARQPRSPTSHRKSDPTKASRQENGDPQREFCRPDRGRWKQEQSLGLRRICRSGFTAAGARAVGANRRSAYRPRCLETERRRFRRSHLRGCRVNRAGERTPQRLEISAHARGQAR